MSQNESIDMFRDSASGFLRAVDQRQRVRALEDAGGGFDRATWRSLAELGWFSVLVAESDGGLGLGIAEVCAIATEAGRHLLPEPLVDAGVHPVALLARLPAGGLRDDLLAAIQAGEKVAGVAWQEVAGELEAGNGLTSATPAGEVVLLNGQKRFVRPGAGADGWIVFANLQTEPALVWLAAGTKGLETMDDRGVDGSIVATLQFRDAAGVLIARGEDAIIALQAANELARIAQGAELAGIARRALELTQEYMKTRVQFGKPIGSFQALQHRLVDGLIQVELAEACLRQGLAELAEHNLAAIASRVKARCAHSATEMTRQAIQLHGAIGTTNEYDIGLYFKRAMTLGSRWGNAAAHRRRYAQLAAAAPRAAAAQVKEYREFPADADWAGMPEPEFRLMVRALFARHYPERRRYMPYRQTWAESRDWYMTLSRLGWLAPAWPREHGGMGLPADKLIAYIEESEAWGVARPPDQGLVMIGPILMRFGTEEQRRRFLPKVLAGEHVWTQGYSEPNAGSDLAAVRTEAVLDGDHFVVNGQKTWTTWGSDGTHMFMLVRTDKTVKKQAGISFLLVDLKSPGITVRPIRNIAAEQEFCEVFFDDVRVPRENLVGELNQGWTVAKALLGFERLFTGSPKHSQHTLHQVEKLARQLGLFQDAAFVDHYAQLQLDTADLTAAYTGFAEIAKRGDPIPASISMLKIWSTETYERLALLLIEAAQDYGAMRDHCKTDEIDMHVVAPLFNALGAKIFAGSNEIQRNILAKTILDLPNLIGHPMQRRLTLATLAAIAFAATAMSAPLQALAQAFPDKPIKLIVPFPPAGSTDVAGRVLAQAMSQSLGQPIIVDNRAGAAGAIGIDAVAKSTADGYTLGVGGVGPLVTLKLLGRKLPYGAEKDLVVVGHMGALPLVIVAKPTLKAQNVAELIALAKAQPGKLSFGTSGTGSPGHLAFEYLKSLASIDMAHIPYKGDAPLTTDLVGGQLDIGVLTVAAAVGQVQGGKLKLLAVTSAKRSDQLPNVPTVAESGVPNYEAEIWNVMVAPAATPPATVERLNAALNKALAEPEVKKQLAGQGLVPVPMSVKAAGEFVRKENAKWAVVVEKSGAKLD